MLARYVPPRRDKLLFDDAAQAMCGAMAATLGETPTTEALALALGKTALETGRWGASGGLWNYNFGNVKASAKYEGQYTCILLNEVLPLGLVWFAPEGQLSANPNKGGKLMGPPMAVPEGHPQTRMRAFSDPSEGMLAYVKFVAGGRYAKAWERLLAGDAVAYVHELKAAKYFTADEATYAKAALSLQREFIAKLQGRPSPIIPVPPVEEVRSWLTRQDIDALEAALVEQGRDAVAENQAGALREMSGGEYDGDSDAPPPGSVA